MRTLHSAIVSCRSEWTIYDKYFIKGGRLNYLVKLTGRVCSFVLIEYRIFSTDFLTEMKIFR